jgi:c-di-GMP-binding flagellar brake protein YcgR
MEVRLFSPRMGVSYTGRLVSVDAANQSLVVQVDDAAVFMHQGALAEATLCIGGAPRQLTVQVQPIDRQHVRLIPLSPAKPAERRARKRYSVQIEAQLQVAETVLSVKVVNISVGGVGMRTPVAIEEGAQGILTMTLIGQDTPLVARVEARYCRPLGDALFYIGAAFTDISRTDALWLRKLFP